MIQIANDDFLYILKKYKKSKRYSQCSELHIQCIIDELSGPQKEESYFKFFEITQSSLSPIGSFKYLILSHKLLYQLQQDFAQRFVQNKLLPGEETDKSRLAIFYYTFLFKLCENFQYFKEVIQFIETDDNCKFLQNDIAYQIQTLHHLALLLQQLAKVVKILDFLLCRESPLILQIGTCILKDFCVIYNFLSAIMQQQQTYILKAPINEARLLYQVYQITIQMTKCMKRLQQLKLYSNFKQPQYFTITIELNKKIELHMLNAIKLSNIEISI